MSSMPSLPKDLLGEPIAALCEAAHLVYYEMIGPIRYESLPPRLEYRPEKQTFTGHFAAIKVAENPLCEPDKRHQHSVAARHRQLRNARACGF